MSLAGESARYETTDDFFSVAGSYDFKVVKVMAGYADGGQDIGGYSLGIVAPVAGFNIGAMYAENGDTDSKAYEIFINKEVFKNTYLYAEFGEADQQKYVNTVTGLTELRKGTGFAVGMIFTF